MAPPGIPKTTSQRGSSSERTSDWAPVTPSSSMRTGSAWPESACAESVRPGSVRGGGAGFGGPGTGRGVAVVMGLASASGSSGGPGRKKPSTAGCGGTRVARRRGTSSGVDAPGKYEETADGHDAEVNVRLGAASNQWEALPGCWDAGPAGEVPSLQVPGTMKW